MDVSGNLPSCPRCGEPLEKAGCPRCDAVPAGVDLKVLKGDLDRPAPAASDVRLVRQVKIPTVEALASEHEAVDRLPGKVRSVVAALDRGDLATADRLIDEAMGSLLQGPGYRHAHLRQRLLSVLLWLWCGILVLGGILAWWLG